MHSFFWEFRCAEAALFLLAIVFKIVVVQFSRCKGCAAARIQLWNQRRLEQRCLCICLELLAMVWVRLWDDTLASQDILKHCNYPKIPIGIFLFKKPSILLAVPLIVNNCNQWSRVDPAHDRRWVPPTVAQRAVGWQGWCLRC